MTLNEFLKLWWEGEWPRQRLGQFFCNKFDVTNSDIFYQENSQLAISDIVLRYTEPITDSMDVLITIPPNAPIS